MADFVGTAGPDGITGTSGDDTIAGRGGDDQLFGGDGNDIIEGEDGNDYLLGQAGDDVLISGTGYGTLVGGAGADRLDSTGSRAGEVVYLHSAASLGNDSADNALDIDILTGGAGSEIFYIGYGDSVDGGAGTDYVSLNLQGATAGLTVDLRPMQTGGDIANGPGTIHAVEGVFLVIGSQYNDTIYGYQATIDGAGGNDTLIGGVTADTLYGGAGADVINGGAGDDLLLSGARDPYGNDTMDRGFEIDALSGEDGDDVLSAGIGDTVDGGSGFDRVSLEFSGLTAGVSLDMVQMGTATGQIVAGGRISNVEFFDALILPNFANTVIMGNSTYNGDNLILGGNAIDTISGSNGRDYISGGAGADVLSGRDGDDRLYGEDGDDVLDGGNGNDLMVGGNGFDTASYASAASRVIIDLSLAQQSTSGAGTDSFASIEGVDGSAFDDILRGNFFANTLKGGGGNDILFGGGGDDILDGGAGINSISGGAGNDTLIVSGNGNELQGGTGNDIYIVVGRTDSILENANEGTDEVRTTSVVYDLNSAGNVENLTFTDNAAHAGVGNALANTLAGGTAGDELQGRGGDDLLIGGTDVANTLLGGTGNDTYVVGAAGDSVIELTNEGTDTVQTSLSVFYLSANVENLIYTGSGTFSGVGSADNNMMTAGAGADFLNGNGGNDILIGGSGADLLIGGNGADQFRYLGGESGYDRILDFTPGTDKIALSNLGFTHTATIAFIATGAPVATTANSTFLYDVNSGILSYDADGNGAGAAVQLAQLNTGLTLTLGDFVFV